MVHARTRRVYKKGGRPRGHPPPTLSRHAGWAQRLCVYRDRLVLAIRGDFWQFGGDGLRKLRGLRTHSVQRLDGLRCDGLILLDGGGGDTLTGLACLLGNRSCAVKELARGIAALLT